VFKNKNIIKSILKLALASFLFILIILIIFGGGYGHVSLKNLTQGHPVLFAHRGVVQKGIVENSKAAFDLAVNYGFKAVETDLNITRDGKLIIFHDKDLKRLLHIDTSLYQVDWQFIKDKNLFSGKIKTPQKIMSFEQFLNYTNPETIVYLDIKNHSWQVADSLLHFFKKYPHAHEHIMIADESLLFLNYLRAKNNRITVIWEGFNNGKEWLYHIIPRKFKPDYYASFFHKVDQNQMTFLKKNHLVSQKIVYGIDKTNLEKAINMGLINIILDYKPEMGTLNEIYHRLQKSE